MHIRHQALAVHLFTASGAALAMLALLATVAGKWPLMFCWLLLALIVDGLDGPWARLVDASTNFPVYDGALMDLIVDYLTYVFVPAYALFKSGLLDGWAAWVSVAGICYGSVLYFSDTRMKTPDKSFSGFPACWNMVALVLFALLPSPFITLVIVSALTVGMFLPLRFVHPTRTKRWRWLTLTVAIAWLACAGWATWMDFAVGTMARWTLGLTSLYLATAGIAQQLFPSRLARA